MPTYPPAPTAATTVLTCYRLPSATGVWAKSTSLSTFDHPNNYPVFAFNNRIWVVDDTNPEVYDATAANFNAANWQLWDTTANKNPSISSNYTNGGGCAVVAGDYVYWFGGKNVRRMYFKVREREKDREKKNREKEKKLDLKKL